jgi:hypothetical protein
MFKQFHRPSEDRVLFWWHFHNSILTSEERNVILDAEKQRLRSELIIEKKTMSSYIRALVVLVVDVVFVVLEVVVLLVVLTSVVVLAVVAVLVALVCNSCKIIPEHLAFNSKCF